MYSGRIRADVNNLGNNDGMADNEDVYDHGPDDVALLTERVELEPLIFVDDNRNVNVTQYARARYEAEIPYQLQQRMANFKNDNKIILAGQDGYDPRVSTENFAAEGGIRVTNWAARMVALEEKVKGFNDLQRGSYETAIKYVTNDNKTEGWMPLRMFLSGEGGMILILLHDYSNDVASNNYH